MKNEQTSPHSLLVQDAAEHRPKTRRTLGNSRREWSHALFNGAGHQWPGRTDRPITTTEARDEERNARRTKTTKD